MGDIKVLGGSNKTEINNRELFFKLFQSTPIPSEELLSNLGLYMNRQALSRLLFMHDLYQRIINVHGVVIEFGVRWGQNMALFQSFRGIYEPFNYSRKIIGFDTFSGFPKVDYAKDGNTVSVGDYGVSSDYDSYLNRVLEYHESESPIPHKKKYEIIKGDATQTFEQYLNVHPEIIITLAYFDFDVYEPTKKCLELVMDRITKGSILAFDELNCTEFPGETLAFKEVLGFSKYSIRRSPLNPLCSYIVID